VGGSSGIRFWFKGDKSIIAARMKQERVDGSGEADGFLREKSGFGG